MFRAIVSLTVHDCRCRRAVLQCSTDLPFAPIPGIDLGWVYPGPEEWSGVVETIVWSVDEGVFHLEMEDWMSHGLLLEEMLAKLGPTWRRIDRAA